jgi:hypothetical protein
MEGLNLQEAASVSDTHKDFPQCSLRLTRVQFLAKTVLRRDLERLFALAIAIHKYIVSVVFVQAEQSARFTRSGVGGRLAIPGVRHGEVCVGLRRGYVGLSDGGRDSMLVCLRFAGGERGRQVCIERAQ